MADRSPNRALAAFLRQHGTSNTHFARLIAERCRAVGDAQVAPDASRVRRWLAGQRPQGVYMRAIKEVACIIAGRPVTLGELGLPEEMPTVTDPVLSLPWGPVDTVEEIRRFTRSSLMLDRRSLLTATGQLAAGALVASLTAFEEPVPLQPERPSRIGPRDVANVRAITETMRTWDHASGSLGVDAAVAALAGAADLLHSGYNSRIGQHMFGAVADLAEVAGFAALDAGRGQQAQRLLHFAVRAAREARDRPLGANILSDLARQVIDQDQPGEALQIAEMALRAARAGGATPAIIAMLHTLRARAYARMGRLGLRPARQAVGDTKRAIAQAEDAWANCDPDAEPTYIRFFRPDGAIGFALYDLAHFSPPQRDPAAARFAAAIGQYGATYGRSQLFAYARYATVRTLQGEYGEAVQAGEQAVRQSMAITSSRAVNDLGDLRRHVRAHASVAGMRTLDRQLGEAIRQQRAAA